MLNKSFRSEKHFQIISNDISRKSKIYCFFRNFLDPDLSVFINTFINTMYIVKKRYVLNNFTSVKITSLLLLTSRVATKNDEKCKYHIFGNITHSKSSIKLLSYCTLLTFLKTKGPK